MKAENRQSWERDPNEERHKGSYDLDLVKASEAYQRKIEQVGATKKKYAICFGYLGGNYQGLQINPGAVTIEQELERALFLAGGIQECNFGYMHKIQFTRAARTDRGVHAVTQCCAMKLLLPTDKKAQFIDQLNSFLPADIRAITMTRVSKGFNAKAHCTKRRYHYLLPTYALTAATDMNNLLQEAFNAQGPVVGAGYEGGYVEENGKKSLARAGLDSVYQKIKGHRASAESVATLREALKAYEGTRAYHNFTTGKHPDDTNAKRYIISFDCGEPFVDEASGVEWVLLTVLGQSFLLNQIRKMVGMAVEVSRGAATISTIKDAFTSRKMELPMAPALGLYLGELFFDGYNVKQRKEMVNDRRLAALRAEKTASNKYVPTAAVLAAAADSAEGTAGDAKEESAAKRVKINPPGENITVAPAATTDTAPAVAAAPSSSKPAGAGAAAGEDKDDEGQCHEEIAWSSEPNTIRAAAAFRENVIHKHVFEQDAKTLDFMYYFDYLRAHPHVYDNMNKAFAPATAGSSSK